MQTAARRIDDPASVDDDSEGTATPEAGGKLVSAVTLIMTDVSARRIFQSGHFLLTHPNTGRVVDYPAQKQMIVQRRDFTALVGFCGIAHTGREWVPEWIVEQLRATPPRRLPRGLLDATEVRREMAGQVSAALPGHYFLGRGVCEFQNRPSY